MNDNRKMSPLGKFLFDTAQIALEVQFPRHQAAIDAVRAADTGRGPEFKRISEGRHE